MGARPLHGDRLDPGVMPPPLVRIVRRQHQGAGDHPRLARLDQRRPGFQKRQAALLLGNEPGLLLLHGGQLRLCAGLAAARIAAQAPAFRHQLRDPVIIAARRPAKPLRQPAPDAPAGLLRHAG